MTIQFDDGGLSHLIVKSIDRYLDNPPDAALRMRDAIREVDEAVRFANWQIAELIYWFDQYKLWKHVPVVDPNTGVETYYRTFKTWIEKSNYFGFGRDWTYILKGCYETYRLNLGISSRTPDHLDLLMGVSFDKLYQMRRLERKGLLSKVNLADWCEVAARTSVEDLRLAVENALLPTTPDVPVTVYKTRSVKSEPLEYSDLDRPVWELVQIDEEIAANATIRLQVFITYEADDKEEEEPTDD